MKKIYTYDNCDGDKGVIFADSFDEAIEIFKDNYPDRNIAENIRQYWDNGCFMEEVDFVPSESKLYVTVEW